jgi:SAM domain (Sterile alpha motif)
MQEIADWLEKLGISEYAQRFAEHRLDFSVLRDLTDADLKDLGVVLGLPVLMPKPPSRLALTNGFRAPCSLRRDRTWRHRLSECGRCASASAADFRD